MSCLFGKKVTPYNVKTSNFTQTEIPALDDKIVRKAYDLPSLSETCHLPRSIFCPISKMPMQDPVIASDGNSYERSQIEKWLERKTSSPITGNYMDQLIIPNHSLRNVIAELITADSID